MTRYRRIETGTWRDEKFLDLSTDAQLLWFYLLSSPRTVTIPGVVPAREAVIADDLRWPSERLSKAFREVFERGLVMADPEAGVIILPKALLDSNGEPRESNIPQSPNVIKGWRSAWDEIPNSPLKTDLLDLLKRFCEQLQPSFSEAFSKAFAKPLESLSKAFRIRERERDKENVKGKGEGSLSPPATDLTPDGLLSEVHSEFDPEFADGSVVEPLVKHAKRQPSGEHQEFIAEFDRLFAEANGGSRPTWGAKQGRCVKDLLGKHGLDECRKRAANMFRAPPEWPPPPHDLSTLVRHFDLFVRPHSARASPLGKVHDRAAEIWEQAMELKRQGQ